MHKLHTPVFYLLISALLSGTSLVSFSFSGWVYSGIVFLMTSCFFCLFGIEVARGLDHAYRLRHLISFAVIVSTVDGILIGFASFSTTKLFWLIAILIVSVVLVVNLRKIDKTLRAEDKSE
jgi:hypothetical protein